MRVAWSAIERARVLVLGVLLAEAAPALGQVSFTLLGFPPNGYESEALGISGDGATVVGSVRIQGGPAMGAFRWTAGGGMLLLPHVSSLYGSGNATCASGDATFIAGYNLANGSQAVRWQAGAAPISLGLLPGSYGCYSTAISTNGSTVVGRCYFDWPSSSPVRPFRWTQAQGMHFLSPLPTALLHQATDVSADGSVVVGWADSGLVGSSAVPFRWSEATGSVALDLLPGTSNGYADAVSGDGSLVAGRCSNPDPAYASVFLWTPQTGTRPFVLGPGVHADWIADISDDGAVVIGTYSVPGSPGVLGCFRWTARRGMEDIEDLLAAGGVSAPPLLGALSRDGTTIAGTTFSQTAPNVWTYEAAVAHIPIACYADCNHDFALTIADFGCFQTKFAQGHLFGDCNQDGAFTIGDFGCYQSEFVVGCP